MMNPIRSFSILVVALFATFGSLRAEPIPKCTEQATFPGTEPGAPVIVVNGAVWDGDLQGIDALDVDSIEVLCWNPETGEFEDGRGVPVINILLKSSVNPLRDPLERLIVVQDAFFEENARFAASIDELDDFNGGEGAIQVTSYSGGLVARTGMSGDLVRCETYFGEGSNDVLPGTEKGRVNCVSDHDLSSLALREAYGEAG
jgi:hypothetical protein